MGLGHAVKAYWRDLTQGRPGRRFQDHYERAQQKRSRTGVWKRVLKIAAGIIAIAVGLVEILIPGPAVLFLFLGGALLATESRWLARGMDWLEVRVRRLGSVLHRWWNSASGRIRAALVMTIAATGVAGTYALYHVMLR